MKKLTQDILKQVIKKRPLQSHKGDFGRVLIIGGAENYGGAVIMNALAAVNSGAGLVTVATEPNHFTALHTRLPEAMVVNFNQDLTDLIRLSDVVLIGSGLGERLDILQTTLEKVSAHQFLIIDGSALTLLAKHELDLPEARIILTPHQMEWQRLSQLDISQQTVENNLAALEKFPSQPILVLKKFHTQIYTQDDIFELTIGGPYQATGGTGDTLAGMIAGFVGQFHDTLENAVLAAVYAHSAIADELAQAQYVVLPTQISAEIPRLMHRYSDKN